MDQIKSMCILQLMNDEELFNDASQLSALNVNECQQIA